MIRCIVFSPPGVGCNRSNPKRTKRALHSRRGPRRIRRKNGPFRANGSRSFGIHSGLHCHVEEVPATFFPVLPRGLSLSELRGTATGIAPALHEGVFGWHARRSLSLLDHQWMWLPPPATSFVSSPLMIIDHLLDDTEGDYPDGGRL